MQEQQPESKPVIKKVKRFRKRQNLEYNIDNEPEDFKAEIEALTNPSGRVKPVFYDNEE